MCRPRLEEQRSDEQQSNTVERWRRTGKILAKNFNGRVALGLADELVTLLEVVSLEALPRQADSRVRQRRGDVIGVEDQTNLPRKK